MEKWEEGMWRDADCAVGWDPRPGWLCGRWGLPALQTKGWVQALAVPAGKTLPGHKDALHRHWLLLLTWKRGTGGVSRAAASRHMPYPLPQPRQQALAEVK